MNIFIRCIIAWLGLCAFAFLNGAIRVVLMKGSLGVRDPLANQLSCISGVILWSGFTWILWPWLDITSSFQSMVLGLSWLLATFLFETFLIGRSLNWDEIWQTYNIFRGEFWGLVLLWIGLMPVAIYKLFPLGGR